MKPIFYILIIATGLLACKKDKLTGELAVFEGRWKMEWYVKNRYYPSIQNTAYDTVTTMTDSYEMEFEKKGKVLFIKNGEEIEKYRLIIPLFEIATYSYELENAFFFEINFNNDSDNFMKGFVNNTDMLVFRNGFPFKDHEEGNADISYRCYFKKQ